MQNLLQYRSRCSEYTMWLSYLLRIMFLNWIQCITNRDMFDLWISRECISGNVMINIDLRKIFFIYKKSKSFF